MTPFILFILLHTYIQKSQLFVMGKEVTANPKHKVKPHVMSNKLNLAKITLRI